MTLEEIAPVLRDIVADQDCSKATNLLLKVEAEIAARSQPVTRERLESIGARMEAGKHVLRWEINDRRGLHGGELYIYPEGDVVLKINHIGFMKDMGQLQSLLAGLGVEVKRKGEVQS